MVVFAAIGLFRVRPRCRSRTASRDHQSGVRATSPSGTSCWPFVRWRDLVLRSVRQAKPEASRWRDLIEHVLATSDPTLRAVFAEDSAALVGLVIAAGGLAAHQLTGSPVPDAVGSILVGALLAVVAAVLINRNRQYLVGQEADPRVRAAAIEALLAEPEVARVTYLRLEFVGPRVVSVVGDVDLTGDDTESHVAVRLRALEARISASPAG